MEGEKGEQVTYACARRNTVTPGRRTNPKWGLYGQGKGEGKLFELSGPYLLARAFDL